MASEAADRAPAAVRRLHAMRLLLVSDDRGFCGVTSLLLERNGFVVRTTTHAAPVRVAELAREHRADVVLVDEAPSRPRAARTVAGLEQLYPRARPLLLCADGGALSPAVADHVARSIPIVELTAAIERCYAGERPRAAS
jgi:DNA-binding NtrC family response regulator